MVKNIIAEPLPVDATHPSSVGASHPSLPSGVSSLSDPSEPQPLSPQKVARPCPHFCFRLRHSREQIVACPTRLIALHSLTILHRRRRHRRDPLTASERSEPLMCRRLHAYPPGIDS